jgi:hypothetical protein
MNRILLCLLALTTLGACQSAQTSRDLDRTDAAEGDVEAGSRASTRADGIPPVNTNQDMRGLYDAAAEAPLERADLHVQRSGWIRVDGGVEMKDSARLRRMASDFEATVMSFNDHSVTFKMPSAQLELLLEVIEKTDGWEIDEFDFSAWDRTGEYYSVGARIESAKLVKDRLLKLLEAAATLDEVLKIHNKLEGIQEQLDTLEGTLRDVTLRAGRVDVVVLFE